MLLIACRRRNLASYCQMPPSGFPTISAVSDEDQDTRRCRKPQFYLLFPFFRLFTGPRFLEVCSFCARYFEILLEEE
jgi:hypothetical protein